VISGPFLYELEKHRKVKLVFKKAWKTMRIKLLRSYIEINRRFSRNEIASETQLKTISILKKVTVSPESELMIAPISGTYYIKWKEIFVKFQGERIHIINGKYSYEVWLTMKQSDELLSFFKHRLESRRKMMEKTILERTNRSLDDILKEIEIEKETQE
jgi:hypothetical protein